MAEGGVVASIRERELPETNHLAFQARIGLVKRSPSGGWEPGDFLADALPPGRVHWFEAFRVPKPDLARCSFCPSDDDPALASVPVYLYWKAREPDGIYLTFDIANQSVGIASYSNGMPRRPEPIWVIPIKRVK